MAGLVRCSISLNQVVRQPARPSKFRGWRFCEELPNDENSYVSKLFVGRSSAATRRSAPRRSVMDGIIYLVGLIVIIMFILSFLGLH
jgi:hypothetical protein